MHIVQKPCIHIFQSGPQNQILPFTGPKPNKKICLKQMTTQSIYFVLTSYFICILLTIMIQYATLKRRNALMVTFISL